MYFRNYFLLLIHCLKVIFKWSQARHFEEFKEEWYFPWGTWVPRLLEWYFIYIDANKHCLLSCLFFTLATRDANGHCPFWVLWVWVINVVLVTSLLGRSGLVNKVYNLNSLFPSLFGVLCWLIDSFFSDFVCIFCLAIFIGCLASLLLNFFPLSMQTISLSIQTFIPKRYWLYVYLMLKLFK